jgi:hypothetical protein
VENPEDSVDKEEAKTNIQEDGDSSEEGTLKATTRTIKPSLCNWNYVAVAFLAVLPAVLMYFLLGDVARVTF